jgi:hypothetical protein
MSCGLLICSFDNSFITSYISNCAIKAKFYLYSAVSTIINGSDLKSKIELINQQHKKITGHDLTLSKAYKPHKKLGSGLDIMESIIGMRNWD